MIETTPQMLTVGDGDAARRIAVLRQDGESPGVVWMQGFMSDMVSTKATALAEWAERQGIALTRFDYSGHGQSEGDFEAGTISRWLEDSLAVLDTCTDGPQIVVGSSMGGYLAMLLQQAVAARGDRAQRIVGMLLIAPAWDMTEALMWRQFPDDVRATIARDGKWLRPSAYGDPYPITQGLIEDGRTHLFEGARWRPGFPVRIIHGRLDPDVPFAHGEKLVEMIDAEDVKLIEVPDGEHRLSRPEDIALLIKTVEELRAHGS